MMDGILRERAGKVAILRIDNAPAMNAMDAASAAGLADLLRDEAEVSRAIVLAGHPRAFCSGMSLKGAVPPHDAAFDAGAPLEQGFNPLMVAIKESRVPIVSAVRGVAAGIGASVALACDIIVAGRSAYFLQAFSRIGLVPDGGSAFLLAQSVGRVRAMELMLLGERLPAETAFQWGLITRLVDDDAAEPTALAIAATLADGPSQALALIRKVAWSALASEWETQLALERDLQRVAGLSADHAEGLRAFLEKRRPTFG